MCTNLNPINRTSRIYNTWSYERPIFIVSMTVDELASRIGAAVRGDGSRTVERCVGIDEAGPEDVSFLANRKYAKKLCQTQAGAVILSSGDCDQAPDTCTLLVADDPYFAFREAVVALHGYRPQPEPGVSELAVVDPTAEIAPGCSIQPFAYIAAGARVGEACVIYPHCYIGPDAVLGKQCVLYPNVTVYDRCVLGDRVVLHSGCVIGQDGFGYATHQGAHRKIPQIGNVVIGDDVEMGAGCTVDRATVGSTKIGQGTKFSDLVAIGHGADVGPHNLLVAQVGLAGSVKTGRYVAFGGQAGVAGHLEIGDGAQIAAKAGVIDDLPAHGQYGGQPALPMNLTKRSVLALTKLPELMRQFKSLQKRIAELETRSSGEEATHQRAVSEVRRSS